MSRGVDPGHFFQTSDSIATQERKSAKAKNKHGNPIRLPSKILAIEPDTEDANIVYVAEAAGTVRRVNLETNDKSILYTGASTPLTSLAITPSSGPSTSRILFAGSWDKTIHSWSLTTRAPLHRYTGGHTDFIKCVLAVSLAGTALLISGGADASIVVWDVATGRKMHVLKGHARAVLSLAVDPAAAAGTEAAAAAAADGKKGGEEDALTLFSADSVKHIRRWRITLSSAHELHPSTPLQAHETSVNKLRFESSSSTGDAEEDADLWTASSDYTAQHLVRSRNWEADTVLQHPDFVRDVVVDEVGGWVVTACRDEEVRVWDVATGELACVYSGHFEEVTGLALVGAKAGGETRARRVCSVGIDGTVRVWSLDAAEVRRVREEAERREAEGEVEEEVEEVEEDKKKGAVLTAEEEAELAELMDSDDE